MKKFSFLFVTAMFFTGFCSSCVQTGSAKSSKFRDVEITVPLPFELGFESGCYESNKLAEGCIVAFDAVYDNNQVITEYAISLEDEEGYFSFDITNLSNASKSLVPSILIAGNKVRIQYYECGSGRHRSVMYIANIDSENFGNKQNPLYGQDYQWSGSGEQVFGRFFVNWFYDGNGDIVAAFIELVGHEDGMAKFKLLDTINMGKWKSNEINVCCGCILDFSTNADAKMDNRTFHLLRNERGGEIVAIAIPEWDEELLYKIVKAWRANTRTGRFEVVKDLKGIVCKNPDFGV